MSKRINYHMLTSLFLTKGAAEVRRVLSSDSCANPYDLALKAATNLQVMEADKDLIATMNQIAEEFRPSDEGQGRGRVALADGMIRKYRAQAVQGSDSFIRLPVGVLGAFKGDEVTVEVRGNKIVVSLA